MEEEVMEVGYRSIVWKNCRMPASIVDRADEDEMLEWIRKHEDMDAEEVTSY